MVCDDRLIEWDAPPSTISPIDRRRSNTDVMRGRLCANGWLVDACRREPTRHTRLFKKGRARRWFRRLDTEARSHGSITRSARTADTSTAALAGRRRRSDKSYTPTLEWAGPLPVLALPRRATSSLAQLGHVGPPSFIALRPIDRRLTYSITWSARCKSDGGMVRPRAL